MEKLVNEMENLIKVIDNSESVKKIKCLNEKINQDKHLLELLQKYSYDKNEQTKKEIMENSLFQEYKINETEINLMIMAINQKLKEIRESKECNL